MLTGTTLRSLTWWLCKAKVATVIWGLAIASLDHKSHLHLRWVRSSSSNVTVSSVISLISQMVPFWQWDSICLYHNCDSTTIRLWYDDTTTYSTTMEVIEIMICVQFDCDKTTIWLRQKIDMFMFCLRRMEAAARDTSWSDHSHIVFESQL